MEILFDNVVYNHLMEDYQKELLNLKGHLKEIKYINVSLV